MIDLLIAGAGPVGLAAAIQARLAGLDVTVIDPRLSPIDKACGEGLMPDAMSRLARLGIDPPGVDFTGIRYIAPGHSAVAHFSRGAGRGVRRTVLQQLMCERALDLGVHLMIGRVDEVAQFADHVEAGEVSARFLLAADGLHSHVRAAVGIGATADTSRRFGVRQHFACVPWSDVVEVYWLPDVEVYVTPVGGHCVGVAVLGQAPLELDHAIARIPALASRLHQVATASTARGAGPMQVRVDRRHEGRVMLIGDAAGYVDALTGEGLRIGFAEAEAAVQCILSDEVWRYERRWLDITRSYRLLTTSLLAVGSHRQLRRAIVPIAQAVPSMFGRIVNAL